MEAKPRILVLEDNYLLAEGLSDILRDFGYDVVGTIGRVQSAFEFLQHREIDGAIVDINLGGHFVFPVCEELQRLSVPMIFLSGYDRSVIPQAFNMYKLLSKPVEHDELQLVLGDCFAKGQAPDVAKDSVAVWHGNELLDGLAQATSRRLEGRLERVALYAGQVLQMARKPLAHVYFPTEGLVTLYARDRRGRRLAVGMVGREGMVGAAITVGTAAPAVTEAIVQMPGSAWRMAPSDLSLLMHGHRDLQSRVLGYVHLLTDEIAQTAVATGHGTIDQRLARWLLLASTRAAQRQVRITHEGLAQILAVRRSGVTVALHVLEGIGAIRSHRQLVEIVDPVGLQRASGGFA